MRVSDNAISLNRTSGLVLALNTPKGRGVFASQPIAARSMIEACPVLVLHPEDVNATSSTTLNHYTFNWPYRDQQSGKKCKTQALVFGIGSLFNHASSHGLNVGWTRDEQSRCIIYRTLRDIHAGEELCINYGAHLTFDDIDEEVRSASHDEEDGWSALGQIDLN